MSTFEASRPLVGAQALGIARAAYEYACDFVKANYVLSRPIPRYAAIVERREDGKVKIVKKHETPTRRPG